ncbi:hypothetical protein M9Y10_004567 [Tritrichomonas musculus]|uniref:Resolvase/invertase-type recombinase catalytic domain-containing protein n=1 Tax=Tritrichomonas musculus TaxID=1915356 RepID=A0ABR2GNF5_9EUKA
MGTNTFYIYVRKSVYTEEGESIESQITICKDYIEKNFFDISDKRILVYKDEGFSGKNTKRPQYLEMMKSVEKERGGYIICYKLDRISRSISDFSSLFDKLEKQNISFISVKEHFDTSTPVGRGMMYICAVFAQMEREAIAERVRDNMMFLAKSGRWLGGVCPIGFSPAKYEQVLIDGKSKKCCFLEANQDIDVVKIIYKKFLEVASVSLVVKHLKDLNIKTPLGYDFCRHTVYVILGNPVYCTADKDSFEYFSSRSANIFFKTSDFYKKLGLTSYNRRDTPGHMTPISSWIVALGKHKGTISGKDWVQVQKMLNKSPHGSRMRKTEALFSKMIPCPKCGHTMVIRCGQGGYDFCYVCSYKTNFGMKYCDSKNLNGPKTDNFIIRQLLELDEKELKRKICLKKNTHLYNKISDKIFDNKCKISNLEKSKFKFIDCLQKITPQSPLIKDIEIKVNKINSQIKKLTSENYDLETKLQSAKNEKLNLEYIVNSLKNLKANFHTMDFPTKKSLVKLIVKKLIWSDEKLNIIYNDG